MQFIIADTYSKSLKKLDQQSIGLIKQAAFDFQMNPANPGFKFHKLERAKDKRFWSFRVTDDLRVIVHRTEETFMLCFVGHHDETYDWAERRKVTVHPKTGAAQIVEVIEKQEEVVKRIIKHVDEEPPLFKKYDPDYLLALGVPEEWLDAVKYAGQRIFKGPFTLSTAGIDVRGRTTRLKLNYRTTEQVKRFADAILPRRYKELDGEFEDRATVSILSGPPPEICGYESNAEEAEGIAEWLNSVLNGGYQPADIAILARTHNILKERVEPALTTCGVQWRALSDDEVLSTNEISIGTMHRAKGLEFKVVVVVGCDENILPKASVLATFSDDVDRATFIAQEKCLFYVACTRARERLLLTYVGKPSILISQAFT